MDIRDVLIKPLVSEKSAKQSEESNTFGFVVDRRANKIEIRNAIKEMYGVDAVSINTAVIPGKSKVKYTKTGVMKGQTNAYKKAYVTLAQGDTIDFFNNI
jgi:large subunit ribosomal protein L23